MAAGTSTQAASDANLENLFLDLARRWKEERGPTSSTTEMAMCPSYQRIIGLGPAAVPLILRELEREPDHWFWALKAITGEDPIPLASRGKVREMARLWVEWGGRHKYYSGTKEYHFRARSVSEGLGFSLAHATGSVEQLPGRRNRGV